MHAHTQQVGLAFEYVHKETTLKNIQRTKEPLTLDFDSAKPMCSVSGKPQASLAAAVCLKNRCRESKWVLTTLLLCTGNASSHNHQATNFTEIQPPAHKNMHVWVYQNGIFFFWPYCSHISAPLKPQTGAVSCDKKSRLF